MRLAVSETLASPWAPREAFLPARAAHTLAVRLVGLCYACAFCGNVLDGPIMWLLAPPGGGDDDGWWSADTLVRFARAGSVLGLIAFLRPTRHAFWALAACWPMWHITHTRGGRWFYFGWVR